MCFCFLIRWKRCRHRRHQRQAGNVGGSRVEPLWAAFSPGTLAMVADILHIIMNILYTKKGNVHILHIIVYIISHILHIIVHILQIHFHIVHVVCCIIFPAWATLASGLLNAMDMSLSQQVKVLKYAPACASPWTHCAWHPNQLITFTKWTICHISWCKICKICLETLFRSQNCPSLNNMYPRANQAYAMPKPYTELRATQSSRRPTPWTDPPPRPSTTSHCSAPLA